MFTSTAQFIDLLLLGHNESCGDLSETPCGRQNSELPDLECAELYVAVSTPVDAQTMQHPVPIPAQNSRIPHRTLSSRFTGVATPSSPSNATHPGRRPSLTSPLPATPIIPSHLPKAAVRSAPAPLNQTPPSRAPCVIISTSDLFHRRILRCPRRLPRTRR